VRFFEDMQSHYFNIFWRMPCIYTGTPEGEAFTTEHIVKKPTQRKGSNLWIKTLRFMLR
jgi:hypothetical protein